ncbi:P-loop containing nucleoside triphosphate hydrolase protein [Obelidium mucronatum]|nr:P-loop containing nucleoside triphosphate hydrolase protein [Obelidium mucronatum]
MDNEDDCDNSSVTSTATKLPSPLLEGLWESLVFDGDILSKLLNYVSTSVLFADKLVNPHIISFNKVVLLHGPPGTGKTSLCRALSQKLSIRLSERYSEVQLVEINSHSLFSKFFSESGKLVMKMFQNIKDLCENPDAFVCVLIDEVESLTAARKAACSGMEPSDAIRVVNALLTQIDSLKRKRNVLILTTSNITEAIDLAFVDRADLKLFVGLPSPVVIYSILSSTLSELMRCHLIHPMEDILSWRDIETYASRGIDMGDANQKLYSVARQCEGLSGRAIRKLPFIAHALFVKSHKSVTLTEFLDALGKAIGEEHEARMSM